MIFKRWIELKEGDVIVEKDTGHLFLILSTEPTQIELTKKRCWELKIPRKYWLTLTPWIPIEYSKTVDIVIPAVKAIDISSGKEMYIQNHNLWKIIAK